jgi:hypothetical protein
MNSNGITVALNAFRIINTGELSWPVVYYSIHPLAGKKPLERGDGKAVAFEARRQFKGNCPGYGFIIEVGTGVVAMPAGWLIPDGAIVQDCTLHREDEAVISARNPGRAQLFGQIVKEGIKEHFKKTTSQKLGNLWQDYADFCEMPMGKSENGFCFCKKFVFHAKPLASGIWAVRFAVTTVALDGQSIESYYQHGDVARLGSMVRARLDNRAARSNRPVAVRVWFDQRSNGGQGAKVFELDEPSLIISHGKLSAPEQKSIGRISVSCLDFGRAQKLAGGQLRLVLDTQATLEDHDETILEPSERGRLALELRNVTDGCEVFGHVLRLDPQMIDSSAFRWKRICPPPTRVRTGSGFRDLPAPIELTAAGLEERTKARIDHIRKNGFYELRALNPLLAVPIFFEADTIELLMDTLNGLLGGRGIQFSFKRYIQFKNADEIRREVEKGGHDAVLAVLPEKRYDAPHSGDTHEQLKQRLSVPSQCIHFYTLGLEKLRGGTFAEIERADRKTAIRFRNRLDLTLGNLLVKAHCFPFVPAASFNYNVHVGIDVGGQLNNCVMACMGYGFNSPKDSLFFLPAEIPLDAKQAEPVAVDPLFGGLLRLFEQTHADVESFGEKPNFNRVLFLRDGQLQDAEDGRNEAEALTKLYREAVNRGWINETAVWTAVEVMKAAEGWRVLELNGSMGNPTVGYCCFPFETQNEALVCTTGVPYLRQGTASPLKVRVTDISGHGSVDDAIRDVVWEADMCFTKPDMGQSMPWTLHIADTGALQLARSYRISGITV